jgi:hypothetical protein
MELTNVLQYLGLSSSVVIALGVVWYVARRIIRSKCIRGPDGGLHLDLSFNTSEIATIQNDESLKKMVADLKAEIKSKSERNVSKPETIEVVTV